MIASALIASALIAAISVLAIYERSLPAAPGQVPPGDECRRLSLGGENPLWRSASVKTPWAQDRVALLGATEISNSYGGQASSGDPSYDARYFNHPGVAIRASSGDGGYGVHYPAASRFVTAVGGTSLRRSSSPCGWSETGWFGGGSGCSAYDRQPNWQSLVTNITGVCAKRAVVDVSAVADPSTCVAVFDSYTFQGAGGWLVFGGTSVSSPLIASAYALAGNAKTFNYGTHPYRHTSALNDVTSGSNGSCRTVLCNAKPGWDGPTGLGTPPMALEASCHQAASKSTRHPRGASGTARV